MAGGRPEIVIDWDHIARMASIHCTQEEMAFIAGCSVDTLENRCQKKFGVSFSDFCSKKKSFGKMSLRRAMWNKALGDEEKGVAPDNTMMIWLSKNHLGMAEKTENLNADTTPENIKFGWGDEDNPTSKDSTSEEDSGKSSEVQNSSVGPTVGKDD